MEKLIKKRRLFRIIAIVSAVLGTVGIVMTAVFAYKLLYFPMALAILLVANGFYGTPFYVLAYANAKLRIKVVAAILGGADSISAVAEETGLKEQYAHRATLYCIDHGYLSGYTLSDSNVVKS